MNDDDDDDNDNDDDVDGDDDLSALDTEVSIHDNHNFVTMNPPLNEYLLRTMKLKST